MRYPFGPTRSSILVRGPVLQRVVDVTARKTITPLKPVVGVAASKMIALPKQLCHDSLLPAKTVSWPPSIRR